MKTFFVIYRMPDGEERRKSMTGPSPAAVAYELRTKHRGVRIDAIKACSDGVCKSFSRHNANV